MHIKQITLSNFRSFQQQPEIQPFSPGMNTVVGRNGSGKSNLFDAVQFCLLAGRWVNLRQEERQALLHEGSGSAAVNAFVELVFDNSDHRFSLENSDEVVLRRTVGLKKDEFFLQRSRCTKHEILSLLEGAGFSKSNPYYIVQQGKVQDLCLMSDTARLQLLQQVAGTVLYDEKKAESLQKMQENEDSIRKINEILQDIEDKLTELQKDKEELTAYQKLDRQRRAAEYCLYDKEWRKARAVLVQLEQERDDNVGVLATCHEAALQTHTQIRNVEAQIQTKVNALRRHKKLLQGLEQDKTLAVQSHTKLQYQFQEVQESIAMLQDTVAANDAQLKRVQADIAKAEAELKESVQPAYDEANKELRQCMEARDDAARKLQGLYAKQGRGKQFQTKEQRNAFLQQQVEDLQSTLDEKQATLQSLQDRLAAQRRSMAADQSSLEQAKTLLEQQQQACQQLTKQRDDTKQARLKLNESRKQDWRKAEQLQDLVREAREASTKAALELRKVMPRATAMGLEALQTLVEQEGLSRESQYFGTVMENIKLTNEKYQTAVEVAAGNALFHVIVDTDVTASRLLKRLERNKLGRVTFLPLNQLRIDNMDTSKLPSADIRPLLETCLEYPPTVARALQHVFSKKLLARTAELASEWSTKLSVDCITLDGDLCSRKGALTGGFVDATKSRLAAHLQHVTSRSEWMRLQTEYQQVHEAVQAVDQQAANLQEQLSSQEAKLTSLNHSITGHDRNITRLANKISKTQKLAEQIESTDIPAVEKEIANATADIDRLKEEMGTELQQSLSDEDRALLEQLKQVQEELSQDLEGHQERVAAASLKRQKLLSLLQDNLYKRRQELTDGGVVQADDEDVNPGENSRTSSSQAVLEQKRLLLEELQRDLDEAAITKEQAEAALAEARETAQTLKAAVTEAKNELEKLKTQDMNNAKALEEANSNSEKLLTKRSIHISKRDAYMRKIQELGSLPPPAELEKFSNKSISQLEKSLENVNKDLKKYSHVNKKAYDQYVNFSEQRDSLLKRKQELDDGAIKVKELVESLDRQKDEAINRTFRGVSDHFKKVFKELVPNGDGELIMRTAIDDAAALAGSTDDEGSDESPQKMAASKKKGFDPNNPDVSLYRGVEIKVRFSPVGENYMMKQLSGGQKALVALALIFAIQRCDPAPFYLFDELDQALDSTYRAAVANLIQRQANCKDNPTQFIVSTFRPELVAVANRCYGISHQNKVSNVHPMAKADALRFVADLMNEEEAVGQVTAVSASKPVSSRKRKALPASSPARDEGTNMDEEEEEGSTEEPEDEEKSSS